jgi:hypothetical protein
MSFTSAITHQSLVKIVTKSPPHWILDYEILKKKKDPKLTIFNEKMKFYSQSKLMVTIHALEKTLRFPLWSLKSIIPSKWTSNFDFIIWFDKFQSKLVSKFLISTIIFYFIIKISILIYCENLIWLNKKYNQSMKPS